MPALTVAPVVPATMVSPVVGAVVAPIVTPVPVALIAAPVTGLTTAVAGTPIVPDPPTRIPVVVAEMSRPVGNGSITIPVPALAPVT